MNKYYFDLGKKQIFIYNIYGSININNIENYLKRIEEQKKDKRTYLDIIIVPNTLIYSKNQLLWAIFIAKNNFLEKSNISKNYQNEVLLTLNCSDQLHKINKKFFIHKNKNNIFLEIISTKKLKIKEIKEISKNLEINELKQEKYNKTAAIKFYKIKSKTKEYIEKEIIEKMALKKTVSKV